MSHNSLGRESLHAAQSRFFESVLDDGGEGVGVEACAADQGSVNLFLADERRCVVRLHTAAVEDAATSAPNSLATSARMILCASTAISGVAVLPVPMAHTGS